MRVNTFLFNMKQGLNNLRKNRLFTLASIGTIAACLFLFGIFYFVVANFQYMIKTAETSVGVTVFFDNGISETEIEEIQNKIRVRAEVSRIVYISAEETWKNYKEKFLTQELIETFGDDNPLSDSASLEVYLNDVTMQKSLVNYIDNINGVRQVNHSDSIADTFKTFSSLVGYISGAIIIILLCVAVFLISTTVTTGISVRKDEISIMKLIGAKDSFISAPFLVEGITIGIIGSFTPVVILYFLYHKIVTYITERFMTVFKTFQFLDIDTVFQTLLPVSLGIGIGIGFLGSFITLRKYLSKEEY